MRTIKIHEKDNVAVALTDLPKGYDAHGVTTTEEIPAGHKFALQYIPKDENIYKYGSPIGHASEDIVPGSWVHTHNTATNLDGLLSYTYAPCAIQEVEGRKGTFLGYKRQNGKVGVRNEIWIIPTVGCVNETAENLAKAAEAFCPPSVDGVFALTHPYGCSQLGGDHLSTQKALAGLVHHPNAGGVLVLGLGCENNHLETFCQILGEVDSTRVRFLNCQDVHDEMAAGEEILRELCQIAGQDKREPCDSSALIVGLKCGGSDGFSGITANPTVGAFSDLLIYGGGSAILTEVPEMFGAETLLMERCKDQNTFDKTVGLINTFKEYFMRYNQTVYENPSPGNKKGGITTLEDKSLGCTQKSGSAPVVDVIGYGEQTLQKGLTLLNAPGNDLIASTALAVAGAQLVLFTTGRGTPFGCPIPTVKIASNTPLASKKPHWIDYDAGVVCETGDIKACAEGLFDYVMDLASGKHKTNNEKARMKGIAIWKDGVTL